MSVEKIIQICAIHDDGGGVYSPSDSVYALTDSGRVMVATNCTEWSEWKELPSLEPTTEVKA